MPELNKTEIVTAAVRLSFPALFEKRAVAKGDKNEKYMATLLLPEDMDLAPFKACIRAAAIKKFGKIPKFAADKNPIKECETKKLKGYEDGWHFINTKSNFPPTVVDQAMNEIIDPNKIFAGCWCRFHINAFGYDHPVGGKGVSFGLNAVQLVREDERFDGRRSADEVFDPIEFDDNDDELDHSQESVSSDAEDMFR